MKQGDRIPTNVIVGFLGSGKTTAIAKLVNKLPSGENWSILINEFGKVSIDHALVDSYQQGIAVQELGGGCACCTLAMIFQPLLAKFIRETKPARLVLEPSGVSHPANVIDILRNPHFADLIDLRNVICLIDPKDFEDVRWRETAVFQDQVQLADIVVLNWTDTRDQELTRQCRAWVENFRPPKQLILETSFGEIDPALLDMGFETTRFPLFAGAHRSSKENDSAPSALHMVSEFEQKMGKAESDTATREELRRHAEPGRPLRFLNEDEDFDACGWIFHVDDVFDRDQLLDLLGYVHPIARLKGVFRCDPDWWTINRAKDATDYAPTAYRRDSRLEIILDRRTSGWEEFEKALIACLHTK